MRTAITALLLASVVGLVGGCTDSGNSSCVGVVCTAQDQCHVAGVCDPATGLCSHPAKLDGAACDDGNLCTVSDTCQAGVCTGGEPIGCAALDICHAAGTCDPATGTCSDPFLADGTPCPRGACNNLGTCQAGVCIGPILPDGTPCSDGNPCTLSETCQAGVCQGSNVADGTVCGPPNACMLTRNTCQGGVCQGGNPVVCPNGQVCVSGMRPTAYMCVTPCTVDRACPPGWVCRSNSSVGFKYCQPG